MILMTIDHAREYQAGPGLGLVTDPMDLDRTPPLLFFLRWISHFCAPVFALLMGVSAGLGQAASAQLWKRGVVLLALEATIINWSWTFNPLWPRYFFQVIAALGFGMLTLAVFVYWPRQVALATGGAIALLHNTLDGISFTPDTWQHYVWSVLHQKNVLPLGGGFEFRTTYPILPVAGLALVGYGLAPWFATADGRRRLTQLGWALCAGFLILRMGNLYGDRSPFTGTWMSLGNVTKYPLSLQFMAMTIGPALILIANVRRRCEPVELLGRVPLFYYVGHLYLLHALIWLYAVVLGFRVPDPVNFGGVPAGVGFPLWVTVPFALGAAALLWPACRWYARVRPSHRWLSFL